MIGIYKITSPSSRIYIGQSKNITERFRHYRSTSAKGQIRLERSIKKYGIENHIFEVVEECNIDDINIRERYWQEYYNTISNKGLNCLYIKTEDKKYIISDETRKNISISQKNKKPMSLEQRKKISLSWQNRKVSEETKLKMSMSRKGFKHSQEGKLKISLARKLYWKNIHESKEKNM